MPTEYTQEYIQSIASVEDMPAVAKSIVEDYCERNEIEEKDIFPSVWSDIITELYVTLFRPCHNLLRITNTQYNQYDRAKVYYVYENIYKRLCNSHCQEITQKGFLDMTGIDKQTLYNWKNDNKYIYNSHTNSVEHNNINNNANSGIYSSSNNNGVDSNIYSQYGDILSSSRFDLQQKIMDDNEESLFNLMKDRRNNPMKYLPKLNKVHNWNMPGVGREQSKQQERSPEQIAQMYKNQQLIAQIPEE